MPPIKKASTLVFISLILLTFTGCLNSKNLDKFVAEQYNNELPKPGKKKKAEIEVLALTTGESTYISTTVHKTDKFLPLLVYWKYDHRHNCTLNPAIANTNFSNAVNTAATKKLTDKLNGRKLELTVEEAPAAFSIVAKENLVWVVYAFSWAKIYIEPDVKNLVVSYKLTENSLPLKTGKIIVKNNEQNQGIRFFQSWKSATSEYLAAYNANMTTMARTFVNQLTNEL